MFTWLRKRYQHFVRSNLGLPTGFFLYIEDNRVSIAYVGQTGWIWRIIPCYGVKILGECDTNFLFTQPFIELRKRWQMTLNSLGEIIHSKFLPPIKIRMGSRAKNFEKNVLSVVEQEYSKFSQNHVAPLLKKERDELRKTLLKEISKTNENIFYRCVHEQLTALCKYIQEESRTLGYGLKSVNSAPQALPNGTKFVYHYGEYTLYVLEERPALRKLTFDGKKSVIHGIFELALPYMVFVVILHKGVFAELYLFFRNRPLRSETDEVFEPLLTNVNWSKDTRYSVCFPKPDSSVLFIDAVEKAMLHYWSASFNDDVPQNFSDKLHKFPSIHNLETWVSKSRKDPNFILDVSWQSSGYTVATAVKMILERAIGKQLKRKEQLEMSDVNKYVEKMTKETSKRMLEACYFLVEKLHCDPETIQNAQKEFERFFQTRCSELKAGMKKEFDETFSETAVETYMQKLEEVIVAELQRAFDETNQLTLLATRELNSEKILSTMDDKVLFDDPNKTQEQLKHFLQSQKGLRLLSNQKSEV